LIGDSGQDDPQLYLDLARLRPGRILAIYIRDVDPDADSLRDQATRRAVANAAAVGVPMLLARDSVSISKHARRIGLIPDESIDEVVAEVAADQARPQTGKQALKDALESLSGLDS
jgi:phosphatidate phosphatase APP1